MLADPLAYAPELGREIRTGGIGDLAVATLTMAACALEEGQHALAGRLAVYAVQEAQLALAGLGALLSALADAVVAEATPPVAVASGGLLAGLLEFDAAAGYRERVAALWSSGQVADAQRMLRDVRTRQRALYDAWIAWVSDLIGGDDPELPASVVAQALAVSQRDRVAAWNALSPAQRLAVAAESARGHVACCENGSMWIVDRPDHYEVVVEPCAACAAMGPRGRAVHALVAPAPDARASDRRELPGSCTWVIEKG